MGHTGRLIALLCALLILVLVILAAAQPGILRQLYFAGAAEVLLLRHGDQRVAFRMDWANHANRIYIPAGAFTMGDGADKRKFAAHPVYLDAYWIDQFEVTNSMLASCVQAGNCHRPATYNDFYGLPQYEDYPAVFVTWWAAEAYCAVQGGRLPTEAQWEKAARGSDGRPYPWGTNGPDDFLLNYNLSHTSFLSSYEYLAAISPYGLLNMAGNVREWVFDWYAADYYSESPYHNPQGPDTGTQKVLRGGSYSDNAQEVLVFHRLHHDPNSAGLDRGFRCAFDAAR